MVPPLLLWITAPPPVIRRDIFVFLPVGMALALRGAVVSGTASRSGPVSWWGGVEPGEPVRRGIAGAAGGKDTNPRPDC